MIGSTDKLGEGNTNADDSEKAGADPEYDQND